MVQGTAVIVARAAFLWWDLRISEVRSKASTEVLTLGFFTLVPLS